MGVLYIDMSIDISVKQLTQLTGRKLHGYDKMVTKRHEALFNTVIRTNRLCFRGMLQMLGFPFS